MSDWIPPAEGTICHLEIPAPDLAKAKAFYTEVFGWETSEPPGMEGHYLMFKDHQGIGGGFDPSIEPTDQGANIVLWVEDIEATLKRINDAGGATITEKSAIPGHGFFANFRDPNGNRLGIYSSQ